MRTPFPRIVRRGEVTPAMLGLMARYAKPGFSLSGVYTPQLGLNMGMDCVVPPAPPITGPDFNDDFNNDFGPDT